MATFGLLWTLTLPFVGLSQTSLEFEAASIRPANLQGPRVAVGIHIDGAQLRYTFVPLVSLIGYAYEVPVYRVIGSDWLGSTFFDVTAKLPDGATASQAPEMLRRLLVGRFGLSAHRESREFPVYALEVAKSGLKMHELPAEADEPNDRDVNTSVVAGARGGRFDLGRGSSFAIGQNGIEAKKLTMAALADMFTPFADRPVIDATGLKAKYDFDLDLSPEELRTLGLQSAINVGAPVPPGVSSAEISSASVISSSMQKALGLTLTARKMALEAIIVDSIQKTPTDN